MRNIAQNLSEFVRYCQQQIRGDEKSEAQTFLRRFFQAFGHDGIKEAGAEFEARLKKGSARGKTGLADLVWRSHPGIAGVVIEMKSRGEDLDRCNSQLERHWMRITPNRPRYAMLCNFDEFWIFDFENQVDEPVEKIALERLPDRVEALSFMVLGGQPPIFSNDRVLVTARLARRMGEFYRMVCDRGIEKGFTDFSEVQLQHFTLQCVLAMFAEAYRLLPPDSFVVSIEEYLQGKGSSFDWPGGLFRQMNRLGTTSTGKLFGHICPIELTDAELKILDACARDDWSNVRPSIFGNIFERAIEPKMRHARGIHFTSEVDIRQIVRPTISDFWEERIASANTIGELNGLQLALQSYRVLDPACGSGNFLYVAYQELKRIEQLLLDKLAARFKVEKEKFTMPLVTPLQFFGMDTNPFAVQLARVTMTIAQQIAIDKYDLFEPALPLDTLDENIVCRDALFSEWVKADAIIGNPPFLGGKHLRFKLGDEYVERVFQRFPDVKDSVDFCAYWFRLAHDRLNEDGRAGLVATNSISQGKSRQATLDYITQNGGIIHEAISTQPWSGDANVHVSIVNWAKKQPQTYRLDFQIVPRINSSLTATLDVSQAKRLKANLNYCFQGVIPVGKGFIVTETQVREWITADRKNQDVLKLFSMGSNLAKNPHGKPDRWIIDFNDMSLEEASKYELPFQHVKTYVQPERDKNRREVTRVNWWKYGEKRPAMRKAIASLSHYFAVPRVSKWSIFIPIPSHWLPGDKSVVVASNDFYVLGILTSNLHRTWMHAQKSTLKADIAYTHKTCFETFPFPRNPTLNIIEKIRTVTQKLHSFRHDKMFQTQWGITQLYNQFFHEPASQLTQLHAQIDRLVLKAYQFKKSDDLLEKLLALNLEIFQHEQQEKKQSYSGQQSDRYRAKLTHNPFS